MDENGTNYGFNMINQDIADFMEKILDEGLFNNLLDYSKEKYFIDGYIKKKLLLKNWPVCGASRIAYFYLMVKAISCKAKSLGLNKEQIHFILISRLWINELSNYSTKYKIKLYPYSPFLVCLKNRLKNYLAHHKYFLLIVSILESMRTGNTFYNNNKKITNIDHGQG